MKVFISWSGERSEAVANALHGWLPSVIQVLDPWMSDSDIKKGARWSPGIAGQLEESRVGLICLTPENLKEPWILFEAGALSKTLAETFVCPYLFDVQPSDIEGPLAQFQATKAEKEDTHKLVQTINDALPESKLPGEKLNAAFDKWWPDLATKLSHVPAIEAKPPPRRSEMEILEEILELVREQTRRSRRSPTFEKRVARLRELLESPPVDEDSLKAQFLDLSRAQMLNQIKKEHEKKIRDTLAAKLKERGEEE